ncbi:MAG: aldose 1-epimerase [Sulfobacillus acidophilus]|uniref:Aldose 1-epimerase n=1 Tax=Sulfobacillus acidophilus TaxID=53633 RepID=A0A2T2WHW5_9FIRM|nr:MAG: aldose 1-epimerase [Sulfobacillus acidophilus]
MTWERQMTSDHTAWVLDHPLFHATLVPAWGGLVTSLIHKASGEQLLREVVSEAQWKQQQVVNGIPVLFPCGRIRGGEFVWDERHFVWPRTDPKGPNALHGFVWDVPWTVIDLAQGALTIAPGPEAQKRLERYLGAPVDFQMRYQVDDENFTVTSVITNRGTHAIPFGLGFHTTITLAAHDWILKIPPGREWEMGSDLMPTGHLYQTPQTLAGLVEGRLASSVVADTCYLLNPGERPMVQCQHIEQSWRLCWEASPEFRHLVIYRPDLDANFISLEPYTWTHNAPNLPLDPLSTGMAGLNPQETRTLHYAVSVKSD